MSSTKHITSFRLERVPRQIQKTSEKAPLAKNVWKRIPLILQWRKNPEKNIKGKT